MFKKILIFNLLLSTSTFLAAQVKSQDSVLELERSTRDLAKKCVAVTAGIFGTEGANGSGAIISKEGLVITCGHVVQKPGTLIFFSLADGTIVEGVTLGCEPDSDAGLCRITSPAPKGGWPFAPIDRKHSVKPGDWLLACGHHSGIYKGRKPALRIGRASNIRDFVLQNDTTVVMGDSGGAIFNLKGEVVAVVSNIGTDLSENNHVPTKVFLSIWDRLLKGEIIKDNRPGMLNSAQVEKGLFRAKDKSGKLHASQLKKFSDSDWQVFQNLGLDKQKLMQTRVTLSATGKIPVYGTHVAKGLVLIKSSHFAKTNSLDVHTGNKQLQGKVIHRDDKRDVAVVKVTGLGETNYSKGSKIVLGQWTLSPVRGELLLGICGQEQKALPTQFKMMSSHLQRAFWGCYPTQSNANAPTIVGSIVQNSPAHKCDLRRGDQIQSIGPHQVKRWGEVVYALRRYDAGESVAIKILRQKKPLTLHMTLAARPQKPRKPRPLDYFTKAAGGASPRRLGFPLVTEHDLPMRPEHCGGPVYNLSGELIGMNISRYDRASSYFLPLSEMLKVIQTVKEIN